MKIHGISILYTAIAFTIMATSSINAATENETPIKIRARVIVDNDFGGDPDGLFQMAHHLLSPSVEVRGTIASKHYPDGFYGQLGSPGHSRDTLEELLAAMDLTDKMTVYSGADSRLENLTNPIQTDAAKFIVREAMREDVDTPLFIACGAGLTDLASAYLIEPKIAERITLVWIGGPEYDGLAYPPPGKDRMEYNLGIDLKAGQVIFNESNIPIWQIPRDAYRQTLVSNAELKVRVGSNGKLADFLMGKLNDLMTLANGSLGEAYALGDNPLVLLTALQSAWEVDPSSSKYVRMAAPRIDDEGNYEKNPSGRQIRVYTNLDTRLMFEDMYAKITLFDKAKK